MWRNQWWLAGLTAVAACTNGEQMGGPEAPTPSHFITDASHNGGNPRFHFLSPIVSAPAFSGAFDPARSPEVAICRLIGGSCSGSPLVTFTTSSGTGSDAVTMDPVAERYRVLWKTNDYSMATGETYRILVTDSGLLLGFADVLVVEKVTGRLRNAHTGDEVLVDDHSVLQINFRIEQGIFPLALVAASGQGQAGSIGTALGQPIVARVQDGGGYPISGRTVSFVVTTGGGSVTASAVTDESGLASAGWVLGPVVGAQTVTATAAGVSGSVVFNANATDPSLVAYYPLDADYNDYSGNGLHAAPFGLTAVADRGGVPGRAVHFNGLTDSLVVPAVATNSRPAGTISLWVKLDDEGAQYNVFGKPDGGAVSLPQCSYPIPTSGYSLRFQFGGPSASQADRFTFFASSASPPIYTATYPAGTFTQWRFYTFTWSATATRSYLDGVQVATAPGIAGTSSSGALVFSPQSCPRNEMLKGSIDEVRIYNREFSALEVAALFVQP